MKKKYRIEVRGLNNTPQFLDEKTGEWKTVKLLGPFIRTGFGLVMTEEEARAMINQHKIENIEATYIYIDDEHEEITATCQDRVYTGAKP